MLDKFPTHDIALRQLREFIDANEVQRLLEFYSGYDPNKDYPIVAHSYGMPIYDVGEQYSLEDVVIALIDEVERLREWT